VNSADGRLGLNATTQAWAVLCRLHGPKTAFGGMASTANARMPALALGGAVATYRLTARFIACNGRDVNGVLAKRGGGDASSMHATLLPLRLFYLLLLYNMLLIPPTKENIFAQNMALACAAAVAALSSGACLYTERGSRAVCWRRCRGRAVYDGTYASSEEQAVPAEQAAWHAWRGDCQPTRPCDEWQERTLGALRTTPRRWPARLPAAAAPLRMPIPSLRWRACLQTRC